jgi:hypothetical protein
MKVQEQPPPAKEKSAAKDKGAVKDAIAPLDYATFLTKLGTKDRLNVERHLTVCESGPSPAHAANYRRLLGVLASLAPAPAKTHGQQAVQFYIPDGKYRMQVFALHDPREQVINLYIEDVLDAALKSSLLSGPQEIAGQENSYRIRGSIDSLRIDRLDGKSVNPQPFYKDMLGWNRRGLRIIIPVTATPQQMQAVETLCALSAKRWNAGAA